MTTRGISSFDKSLRCTENGFQGQDWERGTSKCSWGPLAAPPPAPPDPRGAVSSGGRGGCWLQEVRVAGASPVFCMWPQNILCEECGFTAGPAAPEHPKRRGAWV